jgi:hypothetical protein
MVFIQHSDPGHSWYQVSKQLAKALGIERKISSYSYMDDDNYYLEEDCDAALVFKFYPNPEIQTKYYDGHCPIRDLTHVNPPVGE